MIAGVIVKAYVMKLSDKWHSSRLERSSSMLFNMHYLSQKKKLIIELKILKAQKWKCDGFGLASVSIQNRI